MPEETTDKKLPDDITKEELADYERSGNLELYELNREGNKLAQERIALNKEIADRHTAEADKRAKRAQIEQQRAENEALRLKAIAPPPPDPYADAKPLTGSETLPDIVKGTLRRLFAYSGEWTPENQQGLVNLLNAMGSVKAQQWAYQMKDALATDAYGVHELSPKAILRGSTGLKQIAGPSLMPDLKAIGGATADDVKSVSDGRKPGRKKKGSASKRKKKTESDDEEEVEEHDEDDDEVIDDSPMGNAESPWGDS